jgi:hypothetical protein
MGPEVAIGGALSLRLLVNRYQKRDARVGSV